MMPSALLPKLDVKRDPDALLRLFVTCSVLSMFLVLLLAGYGFREVMQRYVTANAEDDAMNMSSALLIEERGRIIATRSDGSSTMEIRADEMSRLDRHLRTFLAPFSIVKIKIYSSDCRIVYSTDTGIIGQLDPQNVRLKRALAGKFDSKLERKEQVQDLASEIKFNVDVVETYIPIFDHGKVIGSFETYMDVTKYREQTQRAMLLFLGMLALILLLGFGLSFPFIRKGTRDTKEIREMLRKQTITDALTGIFNKNQILAIAHKEFSRASRRRKKGLPDVELGFIMLDLDRFKEVNDSYGHLAGDTLLKGVAARISESLRNYDAVGRFGGEEFLVVLPGSDPEQSRNVAEKIWRLIREEPFLLEGKELSVTASLGVAATLESDVEYSQVLKRADQALYRAKSAGRDQVAA